MSSVLWAKPGIDIDAEIQRFLAGDDVVLDREFIRYDLRASGAHAGGLQRIGVLSVDELALDRRVRCRYRRWRFRARRALRGHALGH
jgi:argininosuccinate lyase